MKLGDYPILAAEQKSNGCKLIWRNEHTVAYEFFSTEQMDTMLQQAKVKHPWELLGHIIIVIKGRNRRVEDNTQYVCLPKGASCQATVEITIVVDDGKMTEAQAV